MEEHGVFVVQEVIPYGSLYGVSGEFVIVFIKFHVISYDELRG